MRRERTSNQAGLWLQAPSACNCSRTTTGWPTLKLVFLIFLWLAGHLPVGQQPRFFPTGSAGKIGAGSSDGASVPARSISSSFEKHLSLHVGCSRFGSTCAPSPGPDMPALVPIIDLVNFITHEGFLRIRGMCEYTQRAPVHQR